MSAIDTILREIDLLERAKVSHKKAIDSAQMKIKELKELMINEQVKNYSAGDFDEATAACFVEFSDGVYGSAPWGITDESWVFQALVRSGYISLNISNGAYELTESGRALVKKIRGAP